MQFGLKAWELYWWAYLHFCLFSLQVGSKERVGMKARAAYVHGDQALSK